MNDSASQLGYLRDPRLSAHAIAAAPAWLWSVDATRILWTNAVGAAIFDAGAPAALAHRTFEADSPAAQQIARIVAHLPVDGIPRLERLSGFGSEPPRTLTCGCSRIILADGTAGILVVAAEAAGPSLSLEDRVQRLIAGFETPLAVFAADGTLFHANPSAAARLAPAATLETLGADALATHALRAGYASGASSIGALSFDRIGNDAATFLIVTLPAAHRTATKPRPVFAPPAPEPSTQEPQADVFAPGADVFAPEPEADVFAPEVAADVFASEPAGEAEPAPVEAPAPVETAMPERRHPLRFVWQMDAQGRFTMDSGDFIRLTGPRTAEVLGRPWSEITAMLGIDPEDKVAAATGTRDTWSSITIDWPVDGTDERVTVELSGLPVFDRERNFGGYRGFGVCRDARRISIAQALRYQPSAPADAASAEAQATETDSAEPSLAETPATETPSESEGAPALENPAIDEAGPDGSAVEASAAAGEPPADAHLVLETTDDALEASGEPPAKIVADETALIETPADGEQSFADAPPASAGESAGETDAPAEDIAPAAGTSTGEPLPAAEEHRPFLSIVPQAENVVPFRSAASDKTPGEKPPTLSPIERSAFHELAKELNSRLQQNNAAPEPPPLPADDDMDDAPAALTPPPAGNDDFVAPDSKVVGFIPPVRETAETSRASISEIPAGFRDDRTILNRLRTGVLVYRLDTPLYCNPTFLQWSGYESLAAFAVAGGLDVLYVELGEKADGEEGQPLRVTSNRGDERAAEGLLFNAPWEGDTAHVLMLMPATATPPIAAPVMHQSAFRDETALRAAEAGLLAAESGMRTAEAELRAAEAELRTAKAEVRTVEAEMQDLKTIVDTAGDGVLVLDSDGRIQTANAGAEALFGRDNRTLLSFSILDVIAPESHRATLDCLIALTREDGPPKKSCEVTGRGRNNSQLPLFMTMGRLGGPTRLCTVFRDLAPWKQTEAELVAAQRQAEHASSAKSEFLAKVSHEIRTPLNSIIGFSEVMMDERFGPIANDRYKQYLKDIHQSGAHLVALLNDLLDLSKIEAGKFDLSFGRVSLNEVAQQCVSLMQPQANQERVIIRTSLPNVVPQIMADARSVRQIVLNLLSNSIKFTGAGGQVIVSTTHTDDGEVVLRVRDTGHGMTEREIQTALEPFRQVSTSSRWTSAGTGLGLPLTKALVEANRANFSIKSSANAGTLVEISFPPGRVLVA